MDFLVDLWLPIVLSAVTVFVASALAWTVSPHHKADYKGLSDEASFLDAVRAGIGAGQYMFPWCDMKDMKDPDRKAKWEKGPHGVLIVWPGKPNMGKNMTFTVIFFLVASALVAYIASVALAGNPSPTYLEVFRISGTAAIMAYCLGLIPNAIWFGRSARSVVLDIVDGVVYGLLTAGFFGWLWPAAEVLEGLPMP